MSNRQIGEKFKKVIQNKRLTYIEVAEKVNLNSKQSVSYYLNRMTDKEWTYEKLKKWCNAFGVDISIFLKVI